MGKQSLLGYLMGAGNHSGGSTQLHNEAKLAAQKFDQDEIHVLRKTWQDLAERSTGKGIDKETFLQYFPLSGLLGDRLFAQFDTKKTGSIDFDDFILGLATVCRGSIDDKIHFLFNMYDVSHDNTVSKQDLTTLLNQIPKGVLEGYEYGYGGYDHHGLPHGHGPHVPPSPMVEMSRQRSNSGSSIAPSDSGAASTEDSLSVHGQGQAAPQYHVPLQGAGSLGQGLGILERTESLGSSKDGLAGAALSAAGGSGVLPPGGSAAGVAGSTAGSTAGNDFDYDDVDLYTNHDMVERAFQECDLNHEGRLTYEQFKMWVQRTPVILDYIESILPYNGPKDAHAHHHKKDSLPHLRRIQSRISMGRGQVGVQDVAGEVFNHGPSTHSSHASLQKARSNSLRVSLSGQNIRHGASHLSLSMSSVGGSQPHSPMMGAPTGGSGSRGPGGAGDHDRPPPGSLSRTSSFGFPTPIHSNSAHGDRLALDSASTHGYLPGEYSLAPGAAGSRSGVVSPDGQEYDSEELARLYLIHAMEATQNEHLKTAINALLEETPGGGVIAFDRRNSAEVYRTVVSMEAYLWKKGKSMFHMLSKRYYLLSGNCMYYYTHKSDVRPKGVIFLTGFIIERLKDEEMAHKGYYGFEIMHQDLAQPSNAEHHRHEKRVLYCKSEDERDRWVTALQHAAHVVPIEDDYVIGKELGRGRFSIVCECVHKMSGVHCAVKIIDKSTIEPEEKGLLRTEIAVLKLVNHPNIIRMLGLYESKQYIYIVMEMLKGGELFERIVGRPRFSELEAAKLIRPLLESVAYLHDLGIVHRDLKPENILCGEELEDLKIADFGLSKMVLPKEKMDSACGTLSYVAPEVLTMQGYGKEADLWSVGVIMFLLLCGKLPFDGEDHNEIIRSTIQADLKVNPAVWGKLSEEARGLMTALLNKNPKERITAREALRHPFILMHGSLVKRSHIPGSLSFGAGEGLVRSTSKDSLSGATGAATPASVASAPASLAAGSGTGTSSFPVGLPISPPTAVPPHLPVPHPHPSHAPVPTAAHHGAHTHGSGIADVTD